jgi:hypothetical protein
MHCSIASSLASSSQSSALFHSANYLSYFEVINATSIAFKIRISETIQQKRTKAPDLVRCA